MDPTLAPTPIHVLVEPVKTAGAPQIVARSPQSNDEKPQPLLHRAHSKKSANRPTDLVEAPSQKGTPSRGGHVSQSYESFSAIYFVTVRILQYIRLRYNRTSVSFKVDTVLIVL
jgi:hypothetical protein